MNSVFIFVLLAVAIAECLVYDKCSELPMVAHDPRITIEPYGDTWMMVKANYKQWTCINAQYNGNRNGDPDKASGLFISRRNNYTMPVRIEVSPKMNWWNATSDDGSMTMLLRKLFINNDRHFWCVYTCDDVDDKVYTIQCFARNADGVEGIEHSLKNFQLPMKDSSQEIFNVYTDDCYVQKPDDYYTGIDNLVQDLCNLYEEGLADNDSCIYSLGKVRTLKWLSDMTAVCPMLPNCVQTNVPEPHENDELSALDIELTTEISKR